MVSRGFRDGKNRLMRSSGLLVLLTLLACPIAWAQSTGEGGTRLFDIPAQPLMLALRDFTAATGRQVVVSSVDVSRYTSNAVSGTFTPGEALARLAKNTGLVVEEIGGQSYRLDVSGQSGPGDTSNRPIDEITVTGFASRVATRFETPVMDLPQGVTIVPNWLLYEQQAVTLTEAIRNVSGTVMTTTWRGAYDNYAIRGFIANQNTNLRRNGVGVSKFGQLLDPNTERVEVLKGPSSVLYGTLDPGGIINIQTKRPLEQNRLSADLRVGSFDQVEGRLDVTGPISDRVLYRVNAALESRDSYRDVVSYETAFLSTAFAFLPNDSTRWDLELEFKDEEGTSDSGIAAPVGDFAVFDDLPDSTFLGEEDGVFRRSRIAIFNDIQHELNSQWKVRGIFNLARYDRHPTDVVLRSLEADGRTINRRADDRNQDLDWAYVEVNLDGTFETGALQHRLTIGSNFDSTSRDERFSRTNMDPIDIFDPVPTGLPATIPLLRETELDIDTVGVYVQDQIKLDEKFTFLLGLRYTSFDQDTTNLTADTLQSFTADEVTPQIGVVYHAQPWLSLYASYSESFAPTLRLRDDGTNFDPSFGEQIEAGIKTELLSGRLSTTLAVFQLDRANVLSFVPDQNGDLVPFQGGLWRSDGVEVELLARLQDSLSIAVNYAYLDARVIDDGVFETGRPLGGAPKNSGSIWLNYEAQNGFGIGGGVLYQDEARTFTSSTVPLPSWVTADFALSYRFSDRFRMRLNLKNAFDERYYTAAFGVTAYPAAPRSAQLLFSYTM